MGNFCFSNLNLTNFSSFQKHSPNLKGPKKIKKNPDHNSQLLPFTWRKYFCSCFYKHIKKAPCFKIYCINLQGCNVQLKCSSHFYLMNTNFDCLNFFIDQFIFTITHQMIFKKFNKFAIISPFHLIFLENGKCIGKFIVKSYKNKVQRNHNLRWGKEP